MSRHTDQGQLETRTVAEYLVKDGYPPALQAAIGESVAHFLCGPPSHAYEREREIERLLRVAGEVRRG